MSTSAVTPGFVTPRFLKHPLYAMGMGAALILGALLIWPKMMRWMLTANFLPHRFCYLENPTLVWTHVVSDSVIAISYLAISGSLGYMGYRGRRDLPFLWLFLAFGIFILACGGSHFMEAVTVWIPVYYLSATLKMFTAVVSVATAAALPFTVPHVFELVRQARASERVTANLRASEELKEALLREVHHRVKNNLAVICSLLYLRSAHSADEQTAQIFRDMENRVHSMALVHENLYGSENLARIDFAEYAQTLAQNIFSSQGGPGGAVRLKNAMEPVIMGADLAIPCGLILNELISNALKHGFPDDRGGEIKVTLRRGPDGRCTLCVEDDGVGFPADPEVDTRKTLGLRLVRSLTQQIHGTFDLIRIGHGTSAHLQFTVNPHGE